MSGRSFAARQSEFPAICAFIETACVAMDRDHRQRVILLVEELFANSVVHGYGGDCDEPIWLDITVSNSACRVVYEDRAPPYDPFAAAGDPHLDGDVEDRPIGGLGVLLLEQLSTSHRYYRRGNHNVIELEVPGSGAVPGSH